MSDLLVSMRIRFAHGVSDNSCLVLLRSAFSDYLLMPENRAPCDSYQNDARSPYPFPYRGHIAFRHERDDDRTYRRYPRGQEIDDLCIVPKQADTDARQHT